MFSTCCTTKKYLHTEKVEEISPRRFLAQGHSMFVQIRQSSPPPRHRKRLTHQRRWVRISAQPQPQLQVRQPTHLPFLTAQHARVTLSKFGLTHQLSFQCSFHTWKKFSFTRSTSSLTREIEPLLSGEFRFYRSEMKAGIETDLEDRVIISKPAFNTAQTRPFLIIGVNTGST